MASPIHPVTTTLTGGPPPEASVENFTTATNNTIRIEEGNIINAFTTAVAALQHLSRGISASKEVDLTIEPNSVLYIGEKAQISQLKVLRAIFCRMLRTSPKGYATLQCDTLELLPYMIDNITEYMELQVAIQKEMQDYVNQLEVENRELYLGKNEFQRKANQLERTNYTLRKENERLGVEREGGIDEGAGSLSESDEGPNRKRIRGEE